MMMMMMMMTTTLGDDDDDDDDDDGHLEIPLVLTDSITSYPGDKCDLSNNHHEMCPCLIGHATCRQKEHLFFVSFVHLHDRLIDAK